MLIEVRKVLRANRRFRRAVITIGCTGGIGSGKSTVTALLAEKGAVIIDADALVRASQVPSGRAFGPIVEHFGAAILDAQGAIDRKALGAIVFADEGERRALEAIVHPIVEEDILERLDDRRASGDVVVLDLPLLVETDARRRYGLDGVLVVDAPEDIAIERLVSERGMDSADAKARLAAQIDPAERLRAADFIILNHGSLLELALMVDNAWGWIDRLRDEREESSPAR